MVYTSQPVSALTVTEVTHPTPMPPPPQAQRQAQAPGGGAEGAARTLFELQPATKMEASTLLLTPLTVI